MSAVEELSGRELDAAVAERVMGMIWCRPHERELVAILRSAADRLNYSPAQDSDERILESANNYSTSFEAAMQVVEKMWQIGWQVEMVNGHKRHTLVADRVRVWWVRFINNENDMDSWSAEADTLPEAICRAALRALEQEK